MSALSATRPASMSPSTSARAVVSKAPPASVGAEKSTGLGHSSQSRFEPMTASLGTALLGALTGCAARPEDPRLTAIKQELQKAPAGSRAANLLAALDRGDIDVQFRTSGGSEYRGGTVFLDTTGRSPADLAISLGHEFVHFAQPGPRVDYQTKESWLARSLAEEKTACLSSFQVAQDIGAYATTTHPAVRWFRDECQGNPMLWERSFDAGEVLTAAGETYVAYYKKDYEAQTGVPFD